MDLNDLNLAKTLECPVCLDIFDEPKLLRCGHTICEKCMKEILASNKSAANSGLAPSSVTCPECGEKTDIPLEGLATNYRLVDLVCRAQRQLTDAFACSSCKKQTPETDLFTCATCQDSDSLNAKPMWVCALCAMKHHFQGHKMTECNKATRQQTLDARQGIADSRNLAYMYGELVESKLKEAFDKTETVSKLLCIRKRGFSLIEGRLSVTGNNLMQEDLATAVQAADSLKLKFEKASTVATEAGKAIENVLTKCRDELSNLLLCEEDNTMTTYVDVFTEQVLCSDIFPMKLVDDLIYEFKGSERDGEIDLVLEHKLQRCYEGPFTSKKYIKRYLSKVAEYMKKKGKSEDEIDTFKHNSEAWKTSLFPQGRFKELSFYIGENVAPDSDEGQVAIVEYRLEEGVKVPYLMLIKEGISEERF